MITETEQQIKLQYDPRRDATSVLLRQSGRLLEVGSISARERAKTARPRATASDAMGETITAELQRFWSLLLHRQYIYKPSSKNPVKLTDKNMDLVRHERHRLYLRWQQEMSKILATGWDYKSDDVCGANRLKCHVHDLVSVLHKLERAGKDAEDEKN